ncbi:dihydrofolate reductase family protein [Pseudochryseolinea flava]|uniref:Dihydrofolate reductase n=1 Tax=Pseudochryseolinea flava TaxID=2059302 RepID=A0A364Y7D5_9BACT|nr:dihydrofolate reductase family protein [Pseudochryseolinea flava]RAW02887.1 dihydrofolate reductase [Pseudochryseolinea flava]
MAKIFAIEWLSADGYMAGPNNETDWFAWDSDIAAYYKNIQKQMSTILIGRKTYETMVAYWPTEAAKEEDRDIVTHMNDSKKYVFSTSLHEATWKNTSIIEAIDTNSINEIKASSSRDLVLYGSASILTQLASHNLIDEYQFMVSPIALGKGKTAFSHIAQPIPLKLKNVVHFKNCGALLVYAP